MINYNPSHVGRRKDCELWSTNKKVIDLHVDPPKLNFSTDYISALTGCWPLIFLHALEIDQGILAQHPGQPHVGLCPIFLVLLFFSPRDLRAPSADRRETLPHYHFMGALYNACPKIRGPFPQRNWGPKHAKYGAISDNFRVLLRISPERVKISKNRKTY